ncbi:MAG: hypothetical protein ABI887_22450 [Burkholderiales bacterium]
MADLPPDRDENTRKRSDFESPASTPRWVKLFGIAAIVVVLLFVALHLTGNSPGGHGPSGATATTHHP